MIRLVPPSGRSILHNKLGFFPMPGLKKLHPFPPLNSLTQAQTNHHTTFYRCLQKYACCATPCTSGRSVKILTGWCEFDVVNWFLLKYLGLSKASLVFQVYCDMKRDLEEHYGTVNTHVISSFIQIEWIYSSG